MDLKNARRMTATWRINLMKTSTSLFVARDDQFFYKSLSVYHYVAGV
jgi:hypothetical protein